MSMKRGGTRAGDYMTKPEDGWAHNTAALAVGNGVYYSFPVKYIGSIQMLQSLRTLDMKGRTEVCWEAIARCADAAQIRKPYKRKPSKQVKAFLADTPYIKLMELKINMSVQGIATSDLDSNEIISNDDIKKISFAAGGEKADYDFITYVAKDKRDNRYCHVFDCGILADDVLATIGQIFNILTNNAGADLEADRAAVQKLAPQTDNPLYHALAGQDSAGAGGSRITSQTTQNAAYDDGDGDAEGAIYDTAGDMTSGEEFAQFLNENVASQPLYGEIMTGEGEEPMYGDGAEPGWGYLDVKPDEDLYGGLADVFVDE